MRGIEQANIDLLAAYDIQAARQGEFPGVWCGDDLNQKITAVGVRVTAWTSTHGFALNVSTDLEAFGRILPCGLEGKTVTSMRAIMRARRGPDVSIDEVAGRLGPMVAAALGQPGDWIDSQDLPWPPPEAAEILRVQHLVRDALPQNERTESL
jgi:lipoate-protein ligase B